MIECCSPATPAAIEAALVTFAVQRLGESDRAALLAHFLALPAEDRRLRFGAPLSASTIADYVEGIDFESSAIFAVRDDRLQLVGVAHVAFGNDLAELGLSVLPAHRGEGVGGSLFERAVGHARNRRAPKLFMHCLAENVAIMHMARKFGMDIVTQSGDADAYLVLPPRSTATCRRIGIIPTGNCSPLPVTTRPVDQPDVQPIVE